MVGEDPIIFATTLAAQAFIDIEHHDFRSYGIALLSVIAVVS